MVFTVFTGHCSEPGNGGRHLHRAQMLLDHIPSPVFLCYLFLCLFLKAFAQTDSDGLSELFGLDSHDGHEDVYIRTQAPRDAFPFYVSLRKGVFDLHYCAGTLISPSFIVTSASCIDSKELGFGIKNVKAFVGAYELEPDNLSGRRKANRAGGSGHCTAKAIKIKDVVIHELYRNGKDGRGPYNPVYDIAVIRLKNQAHVNWTALPFELLEDCCDGVDFVNVGLGRRFQSGPYASSLEMATFPSMPYPTCDNFFKQSDDEFLGGGQNMKQNASICVRGDMGYCQLDRGGGLFHWKGHDKPPVLIGLANRATKECSDGAPFVFTNISFHTEWLSKQKDVYEDINEFDRSDFDCGKIRIVERISGGSSAAPGRYPYTVSVRPRGGLHRCNGVLITERLVLTTASCVDRRVLPTSTYIETYIGGIASDPSRDPNDSEVIQVSGHYIHEQYYNLTRSVNLAVLVLERESTKTPIRLPYLQRDCCRDGLRLRVVGWGSRSIGEAHSSELQEGVVGYVSKKECRERYGVQGLNPVSICAGNDETGVGAALCRGDDGTPLIMTGGAEDILIGLGFSNTSGGCDGGQPAEFLKVAFFMRWIKKIIDRVK